MYRLLSCTAVIVCMALTPALAADDSSQASSPDQSTGAKGGHEGLLWTAASTASYRLSPKDCTPSSLLDVRHGCRSQLAAACTCCIRSLA